MKKIFCIVIGTLLLSCKDAGVAELLEIPVDIDQDFSLPLSAIAEEIKAIELELTGENAINPDRITRILYSNDHVIVAERYAISVFGIDGRFIRSIGGRGQGPGEFTGVRNLAVDAKNRHLFVNSTSKIICYDLDGNFLNELTLPPDKSPARDINHVDNELLIVVESPGGSDSKGTYQRSIIYTLNNDLQIVDSCIVRDTYFEKVAVMQNPYENFILYGNGTIHTYYPDIYFNEQIPLEPVLRDTLYSMENNHLIPELKLKFKDNGIDGYGNKFIQLFNIYRSSRYVFAFYHNDNSKNLYSFCHDIKTEKGYNMQDGYTDDINNIEGRIKIRPLNLNTGMFYYWHTHINSGDLEEPNPTLYIGRLKN